MQSTFIHVGTLQASPRQIFKIHVGRLQASPRQIFKIFRSLDMDGTTYHFG